MEADVKAAFDELNKKVDILVKALPKRGPAPFGSTHNAEAPVDPLEGQAKLAFIQAGKYFPSGMNPDTGIPFQSQEEYDAYLVQYPGSICA